MYFQKYSIPWTFHSGLTEILQAGCVSFMSSKKLINFCESPIGDNLSPSSTVLANPSSILLIVELLINQQLDLGRYLTSLKKSL